MILTIEEWRAKKSLFEIVENSEEFETMIVPKGAIWYNFDKKVSETLTKDTKVRVKLVYVGGKLMGVSPVNVTAVTIKDVKYNISMTSRQERGLK